MKMKWNDHKINSTEICTVSIFYVKSNREFDLF